MKGFIVYIIASIQEVKKELLGDSIKEIADKNKCNIENETELESEKNDAKV